MKITELQLQQLKDLNDSKVNEILGFLEDNTWYIYEDGTIQFNKQNGEGYGFSASKEWYSRARWIRHEFNGSFIKATHEEVETALIEEAIKRGFKGSVDYDHVYNESDLPPCCIFKDGKWAELISNPIQEKIDKLRKEIDELERLI